ncbi:MULTISPECIES: hypothetical protein [unclassified Streptomyces]|uniref:hypothetical protein n=1 Tax=unclassified Streptomyces TaxID=2593676 RepID=UPI002E81A8CD|nr:hypothetical protein [Streptomyces sp. NBC_00589]WTI37010.1 hypothetical protein OIC96_19330 [Streptomyces sp. NBC_00775]WUB29314.1 hypothetical protein OHA51_30405 [Streptomyces sp. NBC_00589]
MASDDRDRAAAARRRSPRAGAPRPRTEVYVNELTGTMSWRTVRPGGTDRDGRPRTRVTAQGAAPLPTHPAAVRSAVNVHVEALTPDQLQHHLARVGALRSHVAADVAAGARMPTSVAARLRSGSTPAAAHALTAEHSSAARELPRRPPSPPAPAASRGPTR